MSTNDGTPPHDETKPGFAQRLRAAAEVLEAVAVDRGLLAHVSADDRRRILDAAGKVYHPDVSARRRMVKATIRRRKAAKIRRDDDVLDGTGIRALRRQTLFTTPNALPPA